MVVRGFKATPEDRADDAGMGALAALFMALFKGAARGEAGVEAQALPPYSMLASTAGRGGAGGPLVSTLHSSPGHQAGCCPATCYRTSV
jgi:hypothetical protein